MRHACLIALGLSLALRPAEAAPAPDALRALQGTWAYTSLVVEGEATPSALLAEARLIITDRDFVMTHPSAVYLGEFALDTASEPWTIDLHFTDGPHAGETARGLCRLADGVLTICLGLAGEARPTDFSAPPGSGRALETLSQGADAIVPPAIAAVADLPAPPVMPGSDLEKLQGEWVLVSGTRDGQALPPAYLAGARRRARGADVSVTFGGELFLRATVFLDASRKPRTVDYLLTGGPAAGQRQLGIYEWDGERIRFCFGRPGDPRPDGFAAPPGSGRTFSVWEPRRP